MFTDAGMEFLDRLDQYSGVIEKGPYWRGVAVPQVLANILAGREESTRSEARSGRSCLVEEPGR